MILQALYSFRKKTLMILLATMLATHNGLATVPELFQNLQNLQNASTEAIYAAIKFTPDNQPRERWRIATFLDEIGNERILNAIANRLHPETTGFQAAARAFNAWQNYDDNLQTGQQQPQPVPSPLPATPTTCPTAQPTNPPPLPPQGYNPVMALGYQPLAYMYLNGHLGRRQEGDPQTPPQQVQRLNRTPTPAPQTNRRRRPPPLMLPAPEVETIPEPTPTRLLPTNAQAYANRFHSSTGSIL